MYDRIFRGRPHAEDIIILTVAYILYWLLRMALTLGEAVLGRRGEP